MINKSIQRRIKLSPRKRNKEWNQFNSLALTYIPHARVIFRTKNLWWWRRITEISMSSLTHSTIGLTLKYCKVLGKVSYNCDGIFQFLTNNYLNRTYPIRCYQYLFEYYYPLKTTLRVGICSVVQMCPFVPEFTKLM